MEQEKKKQYKCVYIIKSPISPYIKIGMSNNPTTRTKTLSKQCGLPLEILFTTQPLYNHAFVEAEAHRQLRKYRKTGEWFKVSPKKAIKIIKSIEKDFANIDKIDRVHLKIQEDTDNIKEVSYIPKDVVEIELGIRHSIDNFGNNQYYLAYMLCGLVIRLKFKFLDECKYYSKKLGDSVILGKVSNSYNSAIKNE